MSKNRHRLLDLTESSFHYAIPQAVSVNAVGKTRKRLLCRLNGKPTLAFADSGSQLDLMASEYVARMGYRIRPSTKEIMIADGSIERTAGVVKLRMAVVSGATTRVSSHVPWTNRRRVKFYVLESLSFDAILGERTLDRHNVFALGESCLLTMETSNPDCALNAIRLLSSFDKRAIKLKKHFVDFAKRRPDQIKVAEESEQIGD
jgi:hypothetical protein